MTPPRHQRWHIVCLTLVNQTLAVGLVIYSFALFVPSWLEEFDVSRGTVMVAITIASLVLGALSPVAGRMLDHYSIRNLVLGGVMSLSAGLYCLSQANAYWQVILVYGTLIPLGLTMCGPLASQVMVSKWFNDNRGLAIGIATLGPSIGGLAIPLSLSLLMVYYDLQGMLLLACLVYLLFLLPLNFLILRFPPPQAETLATGDTPTLNQREWATREILGTRAFWIPVIGIVPISAMFSGVQFHLGALVLDLGHEATLAAELIAVTSVTTIAGKLLFGALADRVDHRMVYWVMAILSIVSMMLFLGRPGTTELMLAAGLQGFSMGGAIPIITMMYSVRFGTRSFGRVLGMVHLFMMTGSLGSIFSGWVFDQLQSYDVAFIVFAALLVPGIVLMRYLPKAAV